MGINISLANHINDLLFGQHTFTLPDPWTYALHICTTAAGTVTAPVGTIAINHAVSDGVLLIVEPGTANEERRTVVSVSGSSPWIVTVDSNFLINHASGVYVAYDLGPNGENLLEPSGGSYATVNVDNDDTNFPSSVAGQEINGATVTFPIPTALWGKAAQLVLKDGSDALLWGWLTSFPVLTTGMTGGPSFPAGTVRITTGGN